MVTMQFDDLTEEFLETISLMMSQSKRQTTKMHCGEMGILCYLGQHDDEVTPGRLQKKLNVGSGRIANALGSLETKGLIIRRNATDDKRKTYISLTDAGRAILDDQWKNYVNHNKTVLTMMGEEEAREYVRLLKLFVMLSEDLQRKEKG